MEELQARQAAVITAMSIKRQTKASSVALGEAGAGEAADRDSSDSESEADEFGWRSKGL